MDKLRGPTSHDVVARVRRAFDTGAVGHAGTLDPMATGVLVVAVGEGTKLVAYLTADDKEYEATLTLGAATDSLDADGKVVAEAPVPELSLDSVAEAAQTFVGAGKQLPPKFSAIKVGGRPLYDRARKGEEVEVPERDVFVHSLDVTRAEGDQVDFRVRAAKGFYVRSLGRDLAVALGTVGHLTALRRTASGRFDLAGAVPMAVVEAATGGDPVARAQLETALLPLTTAWSGPRATLDQEGVVDARHGRRVQPMHVLERTPGGPESRGEVIALLDEAGEMVALAREDDAECLAIVRGFVPQVAPGRVDTGDGRG
ncbi:MAG: tRNA pseudouridine(55) synthase TruB [Deltaproteobacteria bacterium]|nr:tRNA pseudouridine(55) synthase TruB [Deltaproteobacteria bacterium]